jgi:hypothetical protein
MTKIHPGKITYYELIDGIEKESGTTSIDQIPENMRFGRNEKGTVPIVKIVWQNRKDGREIHEYGPDGELLRTSIMISK